MAPKDVIVEDLKKKLSRPPQGASKSLKSNKHTNM